MSTVQKPNIALAISGGGYRAASFSLGMLAYLNRVRVGQWSLLECVTVISTISGGTITGTKYTIGIKEKKSFAQIYKELYRFMHDENLVKLSLDRLSTNKGWSDSRVKSIINAMADVYDEKLFAGSKLGTLMSEDHPVPVKHICFNATEFANGLQFRFQWTEKLLKPAENEPDRGIIGNYYFNVPAPLASHIRMGDILAASSCFPGGFEPINFPTDFSLPHAECAAFVAKCKGLPVGLMDGGIVDNQGIEPVLLANDRMERNIRDSKGKVEGAAIDLIVICDVTSPYMEDYRASEQKKSGWWRKLSPGLIITINSITLIAALALGYYAFKNERPILIFIAGAVTAFTFAFFLLGIWLKGLPTNFQVPKAFTQPLGKLLKLKLYVYENLIMNRFNSLMKLSNDVFLKHIRRLNYARIFQNAQWNNRRIMTAIYELRTGEIRFEDKIAKGELRAKLKPSEAMQEVADRASKMGTTLWYTAEELEAAGDHKTNLLDTVIACGQFTMCWNLLEYLDKLDKDATNTTAQHEVLKTCRKQLEEDWAQFQMDPYWITRTMDTTINVIPTTG